MTLGRERGVARPDGVRELDTPLLQSLSVRFVLLPSEMNVSSARRIAVSADDPADVALWRIDATMPQAWIVQRLELVAETGVRDSWALAREMEQIWFPDGRLRDFRQRAVVQGHGAEQIVAQLPTDSSAQRSNARASHCRVTSLRAGTIDVHVHLDSPGFLVLNQAFDPGWRADVHSDGQRQPWRGRVWRTNGVMRGLMLPAGDHQVRMSYQPGSVWIGAAISVTGWVLLAVWLVISGWGRRPWVRR
jgi:hypothetical protein